MNEIAIKALRHAEVIRDGWLMDTRLLEIASSYGFPLTELIKDSLPSKEAFLSHWREYYEMYLDDVRAKPEPHLVNLWRSEKLAITNQQRYVSEVIKSLKGQGDPAPMYWDPTRALDYLEVVADTVEEILDHPISRAIVTMTQINQPIPRYLSDKGGHYQLLSQFLVYAKELENLETEVDTLLVIAQAYIDYVTGIYGIVDIDRFVST